MGISLRNVCAGFLFAWQASALHNPTQDHNGNMLEVDDQDEGLQEDEEEFPQFPNFLAGCRSGNFYAKGSKKCTGIQRLQCDKDGGCMGTLQGKPYKINCNHKHECVTDSWGGTLVRKYMSTTNHDGAVHWNNGCSWICEDKSSTFARREPAGTTANAATTVTSASNPAVPVPAAGTASGTATGTTKQATATVGSQTTASFARREPAVTTADAATTVTTASNPAVPAAGTASGTATGTTKPATVTA